MSRYGYVAFLLYVGAVVCLTALVAYKILSDTTVPLFGN